MNDESQKLNDEAGYLEGSRSQSVQSNAGSEEEEDLDMERSEVVVEES